MAKYPREVGEYDGWTMWINPICEPVYKMVCCDCGLVHDMIFKIKDGKIYFKARRNNISTGQMRRHKN